MEKILTYLGDPTKLGDQDTATADLNSLPDLNNETSEGASVGFTSEVISFSNSTLVIGGSCSAGENISVANANITPNPTDFTCPASGEYQQNITFNSGVNSSQTLNISESGEPVDTLSHNVNTSASAVSVDSPAANAVVSNPTTISGTCEAGATVEITNDMIIPNPTTTVCTSDGTYTSSITWSANADGGSETLSLVQTNTQGHPSPAMTVDVSVDLSAPTAPASATNAPWVASVTASPQFTWAPAADAASYEVSLGTTLGGEEVSTWTNIGNSSNYTFSGLSLSECTDYYMTVRAVDAAGNTSASTVTDTIFKSDITAPSAPVITNIGFDPTAASSATITWTAATDNCEFSEYQTFIGTTSGGQETVAATNIPNSSSMLSYQVEDGVDTFAITIDSATDYFTSLRAIDKAGNISAVTTSSAWKIHTSCYELNTIAGATADGLYTIDSDRTGVNPPHLALCDMTTSPGGWTVVFNHNDIATNLFANKTEARESNVGDPTNDRYSILTKVDEFKRAGKVELLLRWPSGPACSSNYQHWQQDVGPLNAPHGAAAPGYVEIDSVQAFGAGIGSGGWRGLCVSSRPETLIDGNCIHIHWWYAVGQVTAFGSHGAPGCGGAGDSQTQLLVR